MLRFLTASSMHMRMAPHPDGPETAARDFMGPQRTDSGTLMKAVNADEDEDKKPPGGDDDVHGREHVTLDVVRGDESVLRGFKGIVDAQSACVGDAADEEDMKVCVVLPRLGARRAPFCPSCRLRSRCPPAQPSPLWSQHALRGGEKGAALATSVTTGRPMPCQRPLSHAQEFEYFLPWAEATYYEMTCIAAIQKWIDKRGGAQMVYAQVESTPKSPAHALAVHEERQELIIIIRGTETASDAITDMIGTPPASPLGCPTSIAACVLYVLKALEVRKSTLACGLCAVASERVGLRHTRQVHLRAARAVTPERWGDDDHVVHSGIGTSTDRLYERLRHTASAFHESGYTIRLVGHSLGAGVCALLAWLLKRDGLERVRATCFAPPACASPAIAEETKGYVNALVMRYDAVRCPAPSARVSSAGFWMARHL